MNNRGIDSFSRTSRSVTFSEESTEPKLAGHARRGRMRHAARRSGNMIDGSLRKQGDGNEAILKQVGETLATLLEQLGKMLEVLLKNGKSKEVPGREETGRGSGACKGKDPDPGEPKVPTEPSPEPTPEPSPEPTPEPTPSDPCCCNKSPEEPTPPPVEEEPPVPELPSDPTPESTPETPIPEEPKSFDKNSFGELIRELTNNGGRNGLVNEEKLQYAIAGYMLQEKSPEAYDKYIETWPSMKKGTPRPNRKENATKATLQYLVDEGFLNQEEAEKIQGASFDAAQLDNNLDLLWDGKGKKTDGTVARMGVDEAIAKATSKIEKFVSGEEEIKARDLKPTRTEVGEIEGGKRKKASHQKSANTTHTEGFLWKPESDSDGRLVVLLPSEYRGDIESFGLYSDFPPSEENLIEEGRFTGDDANGNRPHFRFSQSGASYPDGLYAVGFLKNGEMIRFPIPETSERQG